MLCSCRPTGDGRTACCIAVGTKDHGVALVFLSFHQQGPLGLASQSVQLVPHTASVLRMCVSWDHMPPACPFPSPPCDSASEACGQAAAAVHVALAAAHAGLPPIAPNAAAWWQEGANGPAPQAQEQEQLDASQLGSSVQSEGCEKPACSSVTAQQNRDILAAACDRTHLFVIWGPTPQDPTDPSVADTGYSPVQADAVKPLSLQGGKDPNLSVQYTSAGAQQADVLSPSQQEWAAVKDAVNIPSSSSSSQSIGLSNSSSSRGRQGTTDTSSRQSVGLSNSSMQGSRDDALAASAAAAAAVRKSEHGSVNDPDDLVACLRRLRPHLHASGPFSPRSGATDTHPPGRSPVSSRSQHSASAQSGGQTGAQPSSAGDGVSSSSEQALKSDDGRDKGGGSSSTEPSQGGSGASARRDKQSTASLPWSSVRGPCTPHQLKALELCCSTVACFDVPRQLAHMEPHGQADDSAGRAQRGSGKGCESHPLSYGEGDDKCGDAQQDFDEGCTLQPCWSHPVVAASHLSAADGAVAVACSDGMLLLLDQATGQLVR